MNEQQSNPLLAPIQLPGETFTLPSGGMMYEEGVLDSSVKNGEIRIHPMSAIDDVTIKSPDMLFSGDAVRQVFKRCIPQVVNPDLLFARDVDFLLVCLRKVSYGPELQVEYAHDCNEKLHSYMVDVDGFIKQAKRIDPTKVKSIYELQMENGQKVIMRPIRFGDFIKLMQIDDTTSDDVEGIKRMTLDSVLGVIAQVDNVTDPKLIYEWLDQVPPSYLGKINKNIDKTLEWGPEFASTHECKSCKKKIEIVTPLNPLSFFM